MKNHKDLTPDVQALLSADQKRLIDQGLENGSVFLVKGPQGPTGKTTLAKSLCDIGAVVYEQFDVVEIELSAPFGV